MKKMNGNVTVFFSGGQLEAAMPGNYGYSLFIGFSL